MTGTTTSPLSCFYTKLLSGFLILAFLVLFFFVRARPLLYIVLCLVIVRRFSRFSRFSLLRYCGELVKGMGGSVRTPSTNGTDTLSRQLFYRKVGGAPSVGGSRSYGPNTLTHCFSINTCFGLSAIARYCRVYLLRTYTQKYTFVF